MENVDRKTNVKIPPEIWKKAVEEEFVLFPEKEICEWIHKKINLPIKEVEEGGFVTGCKVNSNIFRSVDGTLHIEDKRCGLKLRIDKPSIKEEIPDELIIRSGKYGKNFIRLRKDGTIKFINLE